jgi:glycosyl transferase, family 25
MSDFPDVRMKSFVINLNRQPEKYESFLRLNAGAKIAFERFEASDGALFSPKDAIEMKLVAPGARLTPGAVGCAASHFRIWREAVESGMAALVFEDDAIVRDDIREHLERLIPTVGTWDYIALGYNIDSILDLDWAPNMKSMMVFRPLSPSDTDAAAFQRSTAQVAAMRLNNCFGTVGYVVSPAGAAKLLHLCFPMDNRTYPIPALNRLYSANGIDGMMGAAYGYIEAFACFAPLVITVQVH